MLPLATYMDITVIIEHLSAYKQLYARVHVALKTNMMLSNTNNNKNIFLQYVSMINYLVSTKIMLHPLTDTNV